MNKLNSKNYDLLWKWGVPYLFMSIYLESGYDKMDTISYNEGETKLFFLSQKKARKTTFEKKDTNYIPRNSIILKKRRKKA